MSPTSWIRLFVLASLPALAAAQTPVPAGFTSAEPAPLSGLVLEGIVLTPEGTPAAGAMVVSSAGGAATTAASGGYRLEISLPSGTERVELTAVEAGARRRVASASVELRGMRPKHAAVGARRAAPLVLASSSIGEAWLPTFGQAAGVDGMILDLLVFDDGNGPALYAAGNFSKASNQDAPSVARWDGTRWSPLGSILGTAHALTVFDDGSGPALYVGGFFPFQFSFPGTQSGPVGIGRWDGADWSSVAEVDADVLSLCVFDDGSGPALHAAGHFQVIDGTPANRIARWNGSAWAPLGSGTNNAIHVLKVFDDGTGSALYAGGRFVLAGGVAAERIARWDGASWSALGTGLNGFVLSLTSFDDGSGPVLVAGGGFDRAGTTATEHVARWNGTSWSALGSGMNGSVRTLLSFDDGGGSALYAGGDFGLASGGTANRIARWNGASWTPVGGGMDQSVFALAALDDGSGPKLLAGGAFRTAEQSVVSGIAAWGGARWSALGDGLNDDVLALLAFDDGTGRGFCAAGGFTSAGGVAANAIVRRDASGWSRLGDGLPGAVFALAEFDDGSGSTLYAGGDFVGPTGNPLRRLARWNGTTWTPLAGGIVNDRVQALAVWDDGSGPALFAGGEFLTIGGATMNHIARWNGTSWAALGSGTTGSVEALTTFDDGSGSVLVAAGDFTFAGGMQVNRVARWDGAAWAPLGAGMNGIVRCLTVYDDGSGPALIAGGTFSLADGAPVTHIARWDGVSWTALGSGMNGSVRALAVLQERSGPILIAGGDFTLAGGVAVSRIARWNGSSWSGLGSGMNSRVNALLAFDEGSGTALLAGGAFRARDPGLGAGDDYLARWAASELTLDFRFEDDFATPLVNGQDLGAPQAFGRLVSVAAFGPNAGAAVFDSTPGGPNDPSQDRDLLVGRGNVLILQTDQNRTQSVPGIYDRPNDDADGGVLRFDFPKAVMPRSVDLIDIDGGTPEATLVVQIDKAGRQRVHAVPPNWTGDILVGGAGRGTLDLTSLDPQPGFGSTATASEDVGFRPESVVALEVRLGSSGAVDDLTWTPDPVALRTGPRQRAKIR